MAKDDIVLITGSSGYLGGAIIQKLADDDGVACSLIFQGSSATELLCFSCSH